GAYEIEYKGYGEYEQQHGDNGGEAAGQVKLCFQGVGHGQQEYGKEQSKDKGGKDGFAQDGDIEQGNEANKDHCQPGVKGRSKLCICHICNILQKDSHPLRGGYFCQRLTIVSYEPASSGGPAPKLAQASGGRPL